MHHKNDEFSKYEAMRDAGDSPHVIYRAARTDGLDEISLIRMLRALFGFDLPRAKEVTLQADGTATSLQEHQEQLLPGLKQVLQEMEDET